MELALAGAAVLAGSDDNATTLLINRGDGVESAVVRNGSIDRWVVFGRSEIDDAYRLRLSASQMLRTQVVPVVESLNAEPPIEVPHVVVHSEQHFFPAWSVTELALSGRSSRSFANTDGDLMRLVADEFRAVTTLPVAVSAMPSQIQRAVASMPQPPVTDLVMHWHRVRHDMAICESGLLTRTLDGTAANETVTDWNEAGTIPTWVAEAWEPVPTARRYAASGSVEAVIVGMAALLALGVRVGGRSQWYAISLSQQAPAATMLARSMGLGEADEVAAFTDPNKITLSSVSNATDDSFRVRALGSVEPISRPEHPRNTLDALTAWLPAARVVIPELGVLPQQLRILLEQLVQTAATRTALVIGAHVEERSTVEGGKVWLQEVSLAPGQMDARRFDSVTRTRRDEGVIDREGHFGAEGAQCLYCGGRTCTLCTDGMVSCDCCGASICRRCVHEPQADLWLCPACATMRRPSRSEAREHGRFLSKRGMLIGVDGQHAVVVEQVKNRWMRQSDDGEKRAIPSPSVAKFLSERLALNDD